MIPISTLFKPEEGIVTTASKKGPNKARILVIQRTKKESYPPEPDDHETKEVKTITPEGGVSEKTTKVKDPATGTKVEVEEEPVVIRRKR